MRQQDKLHLFITWKCSPIVQLWHSFNSLCQETNWWCSLQHSWKWNSVIIINVMEPKLSFNNSHIKYLSLNKKHSLIKLGKNTLKTLITSASRWLCQEYACVVWFEVIDSSVNLKSTQLSDPDSFIMNHWFVCRSIWHNLFPSHPLQTRRTN